MTASHRVTVPYPDPLEPTVATCTCGWGGVYGWGEQERATAAAENHLEDDVGVRSLVLDISDGTRYVRGLA